MKARRPWLWVLEPLFLAGLAGKNWLFDRRVLKAQRLSWPVVSVGSLSVGGAGKTPVVAMLAELLGRHGVRVDVLSRGYGRGSEAIEEVEAEGPAARFGDEPVELARAGWRVVVGADRFLAGRFAETPDGQEAGEEEAEFRVHLLDDGFQHRQLGRQLDVVLLTVEDAEDRVLPSGNLREPLGSLGRADVVVVREEEALQLGGLLARHTRAERWVIRRELELPEGGPVRPMVFCGIARPESFLRMLGGRTIATKVVFPDHHAYGEEDFSLIFEAARQGGADGFYTTVKDTVKIPPEWMAKLEEIGPVVVARLRVTLLEEEVAMARLRRAVGLV